LHLKQLELVGFKSFPQRTRLRFGPGITAIVGPNGSGKSNLAEALRWALGEQSLRALRGRRAEDVIFAGGGQRRPLGMAEVSLLLDNADGRVPLPYSELLLTRRLYRSGESEYLVNGSRVRLRDLTDWLLSAGLGPDSYCVVGQGAIEQLVLQRPDERRLLLEDAADVRRHGQRLAETEQKLAATAANLQRARDLAAALAPAVERLRGAAERAEQRARVVARAVALGRAYFHAALAAAARELAARQAALDTARIAREQVERALAAAEQERAARQRAQREAEDALRALDARAQRLRAEREQLARDLAVTATRLAATEERAAERQAAERALADRLVVAREEAQAAAAAVQTAEARRAAAENALRAAEQAAQAAQARLSAARRAHETAHRAARERADEISRLERRRHVQQAALRDAGQRLAALAEQVVAARAALVEAEQRAEDARATATNRQQECAQREAALAAARQHHTAAVQAHDAARRAVDTARAAAAEIQGQRTALVAALTAAPELTAARSHPELGDSQLLGALLTVPGTWEVAISAALGRRARYLVVATPGRALAAVRAAGERAPRLALVAPLGDGRATARAEQFAQLAQAALGDVFSWTLAAAVVGAPAPYAELVARYLGTTVLVDSLAAAAAAWAQLRQAGIDDFQVVTREGHVLDGRGEWHGGQAASDAVLAYQREAAQLAAAEKEATRRLQQAEATAAEAAAVARAAEQAERAARAAVEQAAADQREADHAARLAEQATETARQTASRCEAELAAAERAQQQARAELAALDAALARARAAAERLHAAEHEAAAQVRTAEEAAGQAAAALTAARTAAAVAAAEARAARDRAGRAGAEVERLTAEQQRAARDTAATAQTARETAAARDQLAARLGAVEAELDPLVRQLDARRAELADLDAALAALDATARAHQQELRQADARCHEAALAQARAADALAALHRERAALCAELGVADLGEGEAPGSVQLPLAAASCEGPAPAGAERPDSGGAALPAREREALRRQLASCQRELRAIGAVDPTALDEYRAVAERAAFVQEQIADLEAAAAALRAGMSELQQRMRQRFQETFAAVNAAFADCFQVLFGGGRAQLVLAEGDDVLSAGVEVIAQPPGKRATSLAALSGGERALTAVALLFALLRVQPSPFCVLDEVDAALDEANVRRFAELLRTQAARTQFLVITHNRATMEAADVLYGVTMVDQAVSQVVAVRLADLPAGPTNGVVH
jgi:chromosome segregation protein